MATRDVYLQTGTNAGGAFAFGRLTERRTIVVEEGACARYNEVPSAPPWTRDLRSKLIVEGIWVPRERLCYRQVRDYEYQSLSSASNALMGGMTDGYKEWLCIFCKKSVKKCKC